MIDSIEDAKHILDILNSVFECTTPRMHQAEQKTLIQLFRSVFSQIYIFFRDQKEDSW